MKERQIVRRLRAYENETAPESLRGLRSDAAEEIIMWRVWAFINVAVIWVLVVLAWSGQLWICK